MSTQQQTEAKHTPGPWHIVHDGSGPSKVTGSDFKRIATLAARDVNADQDARIVSANARLIAAAPELLEMLKRCHGMFQQSPLNKDDDWLSSQLARDIRKALAKALNA